MIFWSPGQVPYLYYGKAIIDSRTQACGVGTLLGGRSEPLGSVHSGSRIPLEPTVEDDLRLYDDESPERLYGLLDSYRIKVRTSTISLAGFRSFKSQRFTEAEATHDEVEETYQLLGITRDEFRTVVEKSFNITDEGEVARNLVITFKKPLKELSKRTDAVSRRADLTVRLSL